MIIIPATSLFLCTIISYGTAFIEGSTCYSIDDRANKSFIERTVSPWYDELTKP